MRSYAWSASCLAVRAEEQAGAVDVEGEDLCVQELCFTDYPLHGKKILS